MEGILVRPGDRAAIARRDPADDLGISREAGKERLERSRERLATLQERLFAESTRGLLLVLQGLDASGKDGVIRSVFADVSPFGCSVVSFRAPTPTELSHDYLWRVHAALPARGGIGVFNRSHYEDVVAVRMLDLAPKAVWSRRPGHIVDWERLLVDEGTTLVKVFLHISKDEQRRRLQARVDDPEKRWKFRARDLEVRKQFDHYLDAWDDVISETSTAWAPWHVVPADRNWLKALVVCELLVEALERIDPRFPEPEDAIVGIVIE